MQNYNSKLKSGIKIFLSVALVFLFLLVTNHYSLITIFSEPDCNNPAVGDIDFCLDKIQKEIDALKPAHEYNKKELSDLRTQINNLTSKINALLKQLKQTQK